MRKRYKPTKRFSKDTKDYLWMIGVVLLILCVIFSSLMEANYFFNYDHITQVKYFKLTWNKWMMIFIMGITGLVIMALNE